MIDQKLKDKLAKVYELVKRGTDGEKAAAKKTLDKMLSKYNLEGVNLDSLDKNKYHFKYSTDMEVSLIARLVKTVLNDPDCMDSAYRLIGSVREVVLHLTYLDYITLTASYEYFRRHMKTQWNIFCAPHIKKCRTNKTRNKKRNELKDVFFSIYCQQSNLYKPHELEPLKWDEMSNNEKKKWLQLKNVEGGTYHRQVNHGLLLEV